MSSEKVLGLYEIVSLERIAPGSFRVPKVVPVWFEAILDQFPSHEGVVRFEDEFSLIGSFMPELEDYWASQTAGKASVPLSLPEWDLDPPNQPALSLSIKAASFDGSSYLVLSPALGVEGRKVMQGARNNLLKKESLETYAQGLEEQVVDINTIFEFFPDWILLISGEGKVLREIASNAPEVPSEVFTWLPSDIREQVVTYLSSGSGPLSVEFPEDEKFFEVRFCPVDSGEFLAVRRDISVQKKLELELLEAKLAADKANLAKSAFLSKVSHEVRTPMNGIRGMASLLKLDLSNPKQVEQLSTIEESVDGLVDLVSDLLEVNKIESGNFEVRRDLFPITEVIEPVLKLFMPKAEEKDLQLGFSQEFTGNYQVVADRKLVRQVLINFLSNAFKFTQEGSISVLGVAKEQFLEISVRDTGEGIDKAKHSRVFSEFSQFSNPSLNQVGTGLGLSICKDLVERMGGEIGFNSELGKGSTFYFTLPLALDVSSEKQEENRSQASSQRTSLDSANLNQEALILVVEDNLVNQKVAVGILKKLGYRVEVAPEAETALELISKNQFSLIFLDCELPGLSGLDLAVNLRKSGLSTPIVAMSANCLKENQNRCLEVGMDGFLGKPFRVEEIKSVLGEFLLAE